MWRSGRHSTGQASMELILIVGMVAVLFGIFLIVITGNLSDLNKKKEALELKELAVQVQQEMDLAAAASDGYSRSFTLPEKLEGRAYNISIIDMYVSVRTEKNAISLPVENVRGNLTKGVNTLRKTDGIVYLNS